MGRARPIHWMKTLAEVTVLEVLLHGEPVGALTRLQGDRSIFAFDQGYIDDAGRPVLSLSFKDNLGELMTDFRPVQTSIMPFFSNLLPEGRMREYLARNAGVKPQREFYLLWALGQDLPGAVTVRPVEGDGRLFEDKESAEDDEAYGTVFRFSLAGVQLKLSAVLAANGGLTVPAKGVGGSWIVKLPSARFDAVPENEYAMMNLARRVGINVPETRLAPLSKIIGLPGNIGELEGPALAVRRFDRAADGTAIHIEDFAQVFSVFPNDKYGKASCRNIAAVLAAESPHEDGEEFVRRLVFNALIGNADMHLKNWSLIYPDKRTARLAPGYDFVSTVVYLPDENAALKYAGTRRMDGLTFDELASMAAKSGLLKKPVMEAARETVARFLDTWSSEKKNLTISKTAVTAIERHLAKLPIARL